MLAHITFCQLLSWEKQKKSKLASGGKNYLFFQKRFEFQSFRHFDFQQKGIYYHLADRRRVRNFCGLYYKLNAVVKGFVGLCGVHS